MTTEELAEELFKLVECDQGKAFISDGIGVLSEEGIYGLARQTISINERLNRKLKAWLKKHQQPVTE